MTEPPFLLFLSFGLISSNFVFEIFAAIFWVKNLGHNLGKATWSGQIYLFYWEIRPYFRTFFGLKNAVIPTLTYSAMPHLRSNTKNQNLLAQPGFRCLLLPLRIELLITTLPTAGLMWSNFPFITMSASGRLMWHPSLIYQSIALVDWNTSPPPFYTSQTLPLGRTPCVWQSHSLDVSPVELILPNAAGLDVSTKIALTIGK